MRIKKGDTVIVIAGRDRGKSGVVQRVLKKTNKVIVEGINIRKKSQKPSQANPDGGIIEFTDSIDASNVSLKDPKTDQPTRVGIRFEDGKKVRYSKKTNEIIK